MKNSVFAIISIVLLFVISSCEKEEDYISGEEDFINHPIIWKKHFSGKYSNHQFVTPVLDEEDNIYIMVFDESEGCSDDTTYMAIISYDKFGDKRWEKTFSNIQQNKLIYSNNKLFFKVYTYDDVKALLIVNATNGEIINEIDFSKQNKIISLKNYSVSNNRLYILSDNLLAYTLEGEEIWQKSIEESKYFMTRENEIYMYYSNQFSQYKDLGSSCEFQWSWQTKSFSMDNFTRMNKFYGDMIYQMYDEVLYCISSVDGQTVRSVDLGLSLTDHTVIGDEDIFARVSTSSLARFDMEGNMLWSTRITDDVFERQYIKSFSISQNRNMYCGTKYGLYAVNKDGDIIWHIGVHQNITNLEKIIINSEGDLICHSPIKSSIICIKGDNSPPE